jgi:succinoglycan biosynthesis protein ExoA
MSALEESPAKQSTFGTSAAATGAVTQSTLGISGEEAAPRSGVSSDGRSWPPVSVVMPVLDEERHLRDAVRGVLQQDYPGQLELIMALGPSRDRTDEIAAELEAEYPHVRSVHNPSGATPAALNAAVAAATHPIIVRVDGHALFPLDYIRTAVDVLTETGADNVGGIMAAEGETPLEQAVACAMTSRIGVGQAPYHTGGEAGPADSVYLGVFRREALARVGGYDESFLRAQDWEMNLRIRRSGGLVWFTPRLRVAYRPRGSVRGLARQYYDYGRWRRAVMRRHEGSINARYLAPPVTLVAVAAGTVSGIVGLVTKTPALTAGFVLPAGYALGILTGAAITGRGLSPAALVRLPAVYATMHGCWGAGFLTSPRRLAEADSSSPATWEAGR